MPKLFVILFEGHIHSYRQIFFDRKEHPKDANPNWYGDSLGHWEDDAPVVETVGINDRTWMIEFPPPPCAPCKVSPRQAGFLKCAMLVSMRFASVLLALAASCARADVADSSSAGFTVKLSLNIQAAPAEVYRKLVRNIGDWWNPEHTFSQDAHNLSIEDKPLGCFCEKLPNQGGVRHLEVIYADPGKTLILSGGLGPLLSLAATGSLAIQLSPASGGTNVNVTYSVAGYLPAGMNTWAAPVDAVLTEQFTRLKNYVERGVPAPPKPQ